MLNELQKLSMLTLIKFLLTTQIPPPLCFPQIFELPRGSFSNTALYNSVLTNFSIGKVGFTN